MTYGSYENGKFFVPFQVNSHDTDRYGRLRPSMPLRYIHEAANLQFESSHPTLDELRDKEHKGFILSRVAFDLARPLRAYEKLTAATWAGASSGVSFVRCGQLFDNSGAIVGRSVSIWALVDLDNRSFVRVKDIDLGIPSLDELPGIPLPGHVRIPASLPLSPVGVRTVYESDTDVNGHMNNTVYPTMLADFLPNAGGKVIRAYTIAYLNEAKYGETFTVLAAEEGNTVYLRTVKADGTVGVNALFTLADLPSANDPA